MRNTRILPDSEYLEAKARAARIKRMGDDLEDLLILLFIVSGARRAAEGDARYRSMRIHQFSGEFVDDIKVTYPTQRRTRYVHAKSGRTTKWDRNLVRDFRSQCAKLQGSRGFVLELWVRFGQKRTELRAKLPKNMPRIQIQVLPHQWAKGRPADIPHVRKHLPLLLQSGNSERQLRRAWSHIETAWRDQYDDATEIHEASVSDVLECAHDLSLGAIRSLWPTNPDLTAFAASISGIRGLKISADGETLIYWSNEFGGRFGSDPKRADWPWLQKRLQVLGNPRSLADFVVLVGRDTMSLRQDLKSAYTAKGEYLLHSGEASISDFVNVLEPFTLDLATAVNRVIQAHALIPFVIGTGGDFQEFTAPFISYLERPYGYGVGCLWPYQSKPNHTNIRPIYFDQEYLEKTPVQPNLLIIAQSVVNDLDPIAAVVERALELRPNMDVLIVAGASTTAAARRIRRTFRNMLRVVSAASMPEAFVGDSDLNYWTVADYLDRREYKYWRLPPERRFEF